MLGIPIKSTLKSYTEGFNNLRKLSMINNSNQDIVKNLAQKKPKEKSSDDFFTINIFKISLSIKNSFIFNYLLANYLHNMPKISKLLNNYCCFSDFEMTFLLFIFYLISENSYDSSLDSVNAFAEVFCQGAFGFNCYNDYALGTSFGYGFFSFWS